MPRPKPCLLLFPLRVGNGESHDHGKTYYDKKNKTTTAKAITTAKATKATEKAAEIINADGATVTATKEISCTMTLWQRIVRWFKGLFGAARLMKAIEH